MNKLRLIMGKLKFLSISILIASFPFKVNAQNNYTYKILFNFGSIDNNQSVSTNTHLFSTFDNFLFEYIIEVKKESKLNNGRVSIERVEEKVKFDMVGVYNTPQNSDQRLG